VGVESCRNCNDGQTVGHGWWDFMDGFICNNCPAGSSSQSPWLQCALCPLGKESVSGGICECPAGTYGNPNAVITTGATHCIPCPVGTYTNSPGFLHCNTCIGTTGMSSAEGSSGCAFLCTTGQFSEYFFTRMVDNVYSEAQATPCAPCPAGHYGFLIPSTIVATLGIGQCEPCPVNSYTDQGGLAQCLPCPTGKITPSTASASVSACVLPCTPGQFREVPDHQTCTDCPAGKFANTTAVSIHGAPQAQACVLCPPGTFSTALKSLTQATCSPCGAGKFSTALGPDAGIVCALCPAGMYSSATAAHDATTCVPCSPGTFSGASGATSENQCQSCVAGKYLSGIGATSAQDCLSCSAGTHGPHFHCSEGPKARTLFTVSLSEGPQARTFTAVIPTTPTRE